MDVGVDGHPGSVPVPLDGVVVPTPGCVHLAGESGAPAQSKQTILAILMQKQQQ